MSTTQSYNDPNLSPERIQRQKKMQKRKKSNAKLSKRTDHMNRKLLLLVILAIAFFESDIITKMMTSSSQIASNERVIQDKLESEKAIQRASEEAIRESEEKAAAESEAAARAHSRNIPDSDSIVIAQPTPCDDSYFENAVFIGDSRVEGFRNLSGLASNYLCAVGMQISSFYDTPYIATADGPITVMEALEKRQYDKVYVMMGVNELGWYSWDGFHDSYRQILADIHAAQPDAIMYVYGCFYVEEDKVETSYIKNENVNIVNKYILQICQEDNYNYLDLNLVFENEKGGLIEGASADGVHLNQEYYPIWVDYLKSHYIPDNGTKKIEKAEKSETAPAETEASSSEDNADQAASEEAGAENEEPAASPSEDTEAPAQTEAATEKVTEPETENYFGVDYDALPPTIRIKQTKN